mmetsp:Transcript_8073/g.14871  ORF Transcript_8073/g.14871 Transcript_8073/m.14871 type:complete len:502 (+) Transcript_8073:83-1588(+)
MALFRTAEFLFVILQIPCAIGQPLATLLATSSTPVPVTIASPLQLIGDEIISAPPPAKTPATMTPAVTITSLDAKTGTEARATWDARLLIAKEPAPDHGSNSKWWILNVGGLACELVLGGGYFVTMVQNLHFDPHMNQRHAPILNLQVSIAWAAAIQFLPFAASALNLASVSSGLPWLMHHFYTISLVLVSPALSGQAATYAVPPLGDWYGMGKHVESTPPSFPRARALFLYIMIVLNHFDQYSDSMTCAIALNASWTYAWMMVFILLSSLALQVATAYSLTNLRKTVRLFAGQPPDAFAAEGRAAAASRANHFERLAQHFDAMQSKAESMLAEREEKERLQQEWMERYGKEKDLMERGLLEKTLPYDLAFPTKEQIETQAKAYIQELDKQQDEATEATEYEMKLAERTEAVQGITRLLTENIPQAILSIRFAREVKPSKVVYASVGLSLTLAVKAFLGGAYSFAKNGCNKISEPVDNRVYNGYFEAQRAASEASRQAYEP